MPRCGIVILAAGGSTRMGSPKQLLEFEGATLLQRAVNTALQTVCDPVVVVLGSGAAEIQKTLASSAVKVVTNENWSRGMGTSIRAGMQAIADEPIQAVMIFLCDQPLISASVLNDLITAHFANGQAITAARYAGSPGTPVIFPTSLFPDLLNLKDEQGGKAILQRYPRQIQSIDIPQAEEDIDTKEDFERLVKRMR